MYWCLDGILTCRELISASPAGFRRPWVPPHGVQNRLCTSTWGPKPPMYLNMGCKTTLCTSTWGPKPPYVPQHGVQNRRCTSTWGSKTPLCNFYRPVYKAYASLRPTSLDMLV